MQTTLNQRRDIAHVRPARLFPWADPDENPEPFDPATLDEARRRLDDAGTRMKDCLDTLDRARREFEKALNTYVIMYRQSRIERIST